ncbi:MAG: hypothetical protein ABIO06_05810 [Pseudolysinimonas sp.]
MTSTPSVAHRSRAALHLLWTIPLATALSSVFFVAGAFMLCGVSGCSGGGFGPSYQYLADSWICCVVIAVLYFVSLVFVPWIRPLQRRLLASAAIGLVIGATVAVYYLAQLRHF